MDAALPQRPGICRALACSEITTANSRRTTFVPPRSDESCTGSTLLAGSAGVLGSSARLDRRLAPYLAPTLVHTSLIANSSRIIGVPPRFEESCTGSTLLLGPVGVRRFYGRFDGRLPPYVAPTLAHTSLIANSSHIIGVPPRFEEVYTLKTLIR
jgi:hypothetical protein